jgi:hypothetical protein
MKHVLLALFLMATGAAVAQTPVSLKVNQSAEQVKENAGNGILEVTLTGTTADEIKKAAAMYTSYFSVAEIKQEKNGIVLKLRAVSEDAMNVKVMYRLMVTLKAAETEFGGKTMSTESFFNQYIF